MSLGPSKISDSSSNGMILVAFIFFVVIVVLLFVGVFGFLACQRSRNKRSKGMCPSSSKSSESSCSELMEKAESEERLLRNQKPDMENPQNRRAPVESEDQTGRLDSVCKTEFSLVHNCTYLNILPSLVK